MAVLSVWIDAPAARAAEGGGVDPESRVRRVCATGGTVARRERPGAVPGGGPDRDVVQLRHGERVLLLGRVMQRRGPALRIWARGDTLLVAADRHGLCYPSWRARRTCPQAGVVALRDQPGVGGRSEVPAGHPVRHFGLEHAGWSYIGVELATGRREGWAPSGSLCLPEPLPEDTGIPLRQVCGEDVLLLGQPSPGAEPLAALAPGSFVFLRDRERGADGEFLVVEAAGVRGYVAAHGQPLCYATYVERSVCNAGQGAPVRHDPAPGSGVAVTLRDRHRLRFHGHREAGFAYVHFTHQGQSLVGWLSGEFVCEAAPAPPPGLPIEEAMAHTRALGIRAVGYAEGTWSAADQPTDAYYGHGDSGRHNVGIFSCTVCGSRGPEAADEYYLSQHRLPYANVPLRQSASLYRAAVERHGLAAAIDHPMLVGAYLLLATQSPAATFDRRGFLDERMGRLARSGLSCAALRDALVDAFRDPDDDGTVLFQGGLARARHDQLRRLSFFEWFYRRHGDASHLEGFDGCRELCRQELAPYGACPW